jgi:enoyl-CoA hydratase/carnithine racemase
MSDILSHAEAGVLTLTFNRLDRKHAITAAMYAALADALAAARDDGALRAVVIQGHEQVFSAGNDLGDFLDAPPTGTDAPVWRFLHAIADFPKPLVAAACGAAVGVGTTLLLHCDLVYAGDNARFSLPFVNLGLCPEAASSLLLPRRIGLARAAEALLLADPFGAEQALEWGLVNRILPPLEVNAHAQAQARRLAEKPLGSLLATKRLLKLEDGDAVRRRLAEEGEVFARMLDEPAAREAFSAFMAKRKPDFSRC